MCGREWDGVGVEKGGGKKLVCLTSCAFLCLGFGLVSFLVRVVTDWEVGVMGPKVSRFKMYEKIQSNLTVVQKKG